MNEATRDLLVEAKGYLERASDLLRMARSRSPKDMLTRNAFLMSVKTYDLTIESLQRNAPIQPHQGKEIESLYNSHDGD